MYFLIELTTFAGCTFYLAISSGHILGQHIYLYIVLWITHFSVRLLPSLGFFSVHKLYIMPILAYTVYDGLHAMSGAGTTDAGWPAEPSVFDIWHFVEKVF